MMRKSFIILCLAAVSFRLSAESVYTQDLTKDLIIGSASLTLAVSSLFIDFSVNGVSRDDIPPRDSINAFDRGLVFAYNQPLSIVSDVAVYGLAVLPVLSIISRDKSAWLTYLLMYAESTLLVFGTTEMLKISIARYRPYCYEGGIPSGKDDYYKSFPSRHTAFAFMSAGFLVSTFAAEYPDSPWKLPLGAAAYTLAAGIGAGRIFSGSHFLSDVLAGAAIGSLWGLLVPRLHLKKDSGSAAIAPLAGGLAVSYRF